MSPTFPRITYPSTGQSLQANGEPMPYMPNEAADGAAFYTPSQTPPAGTALDPQPDGGPIPKLFTPIKIRGVTFPNRIFASPLCQYSAHEGFVNMWHQAYIGGLVQRGPGLTFVEDTAVSANGRITPEDAGIWLDAHVAAWKPIVEFAHSQGQKIGMQLGHAGRKASTLAPWVDPMAFDRAASVEVGGWPDDVVAPSAVAFSDTFPQPRALETNGIRQVTHDFANAAKRAVVAGFDVLEIHAAHGFLLHEFMSPVANKRTDAYGGSFENRSRLMLEVVDAVRAVIPDDMPLMVRVSATDWLEDADDFGPEKSWTLDQTTQLAKLLAQRGVDVLDVSSVGAISQLAQARLKRHQDVFSPGSTLGFPQSIKKAVGDDLLVTSLGGITQGRQAQAALVGDTTAGHVPLDAVVVGRAFLKNPAVVRQFAEDVGVYIHLAKQMGWPVGGYGGGPGAART